MPHDTPPSTPPRIWFNTSDPGPWTRCFRRRFVVGDEADDASLRVFAESRYLLWVNGRFVAQGPAFGHPMRAPFDRHDITPLLTPGPNVIAALVHAANQGTHQHVPSGEPGLSASLVWRDDQGEHRLEADEAWRVTPVTGWVWPTPKRGWALGPIEQFDARLAPRGWQAVGFDDSTWDSPEVSPLGAAVPGGVTAVERPTPPLARSFVAPASLTGFDAVTSAVAPIQEDDPADALGQRIMSLQRERPPASLKLEDHEAPETFAVTGLGPEVGAAVHLDLGAFYVGQIVLECECPGEGVIDVAWGEVDEDGRANCLRKGASYVDRIHAAEGRIDWRPIGFSGMRYLTLVFRGFSGDITVTRVGIDASEPDLNWAGDFECSDEQLNAVWRVCERTIRVGTQDALMDCPTREQATYIGDGLPVAKWIAQLTGDTRFWRDLVIEQFRRQAGRGLIRSTPFSCLDGTLIDYVLIAIIGTSDYLHWTADRDTARQVLPAARRAMSWFDTHRDEQGMMTWRWPIKGRDRPPEHVYDPHRPIIDSMNLFIDHPGLGWHNRGDAGIDRRGINAAIHALQVIARRALAELEDAVGDPELASRQRAEASALAKRCKAMFFDAERDVFADGVFEGERLAQVSEQTNTWSILAGLLDDDHAARVLGRLIESTDPAIARSGYYFWVYQLRVLSGLGMMREALASIGRLWPRVLDAGATAVWETPAGDELDSRCHPWSCVPVSFLLTDVLGLGGLEAPADQPKTIHPRYDLLPEAGGAMFTRDGRCALRWRRGPGGDVTLEGELPDGVRAMVITPAGEDAGQAEGVWAYTLGSGKLHE